MKQTLRQSIEKIVTNNNILFSLEDRDYKMISLSKIIKEGNL